jgi:hypothetical protein
VNEPGHLGAYLALFTEIGLVLLVTILACVLAGYWLDERLGTLPIFAMLGLFAGLTIGGLAVYRLITRFLARFG